MDPLKIGISARLLYPDARRTFLPTKALQYLEQSVANWVMSAEVLAFMIPELSLATPHAPVTKVKPIFGICHVQQLINRPFCGTLYQELQPQRDGKAQPSNNAKYENCYHD